MHMVSENITNKLLEHGIKPSYPRIKVMEYLMKWKSHPTVDEIYTELVREMPTLSKTTVYNTLDLLLKNNLAQLISIEDHEARYDADVTSHGHFKCIRCGVIDDFFLDMDVIQCPTLVQYNIREKHVYFKGVCPHCLEENQ